jgi:catechol 2,3-dioxygenase-like lactoylglutathione lyase family enzyme
MKPESLVAMLRTRRMQESVWFYRDVLSFECVEQTEQWACLTKDGFELTLALPNEHEPFNQPGLTGAPYFRTQDVDAVWKQIQGKARVVYPIENFDYGMREYAIFDNNGYCLQFGKEIG